MAGKCAKSRTVPGAGARVVQAEPQAPAADGAQESPWVRIGEAIHERIGHKVTTAKLDHLATVLERFEQAYAPALAPMFTELANNPATPDELRPLLLELAEPAHFTAALGIGIAAGAIISPVLGAATAPYVQVLANDAWARNASAPLSPAEVALGMLRHNPYIPNPQHEATLSGIAENRLNALLYNVGEALALGELLLLFRRGQIDEARLIQGLRQSRIRDEWLPEIKMLQFAPPPAASAIAAAVQNHLTIDEATRHVKDAGINPDNFGWLYETHGRPPGAEQMLHLLNRGEMTEDEVRQGIRESDIKNKYIDAIIASRVYLPPPRSIVPMLRSGSITEARARQLLKEHGVRDEDVAAFIGEASTTRTTAERQLSASQALRAYEERLIDRAEVVARLTKLRYPPADVDLMIGIADQAVEERFRNAAISRVHSRYVAHKMSQADAQAALGKLKLPASAVTSLLTLWGDERAANVNVLTVSQWQQGYHRGIIRLDQLIAQLKNFGYHGVEIKILAAESFPPNRVPQEVMALDPATL